MRTGNTPCPQSFQVWERRRRQRMTECCPRSEAEYLARPRSPFIAARHSGDRVDAELHYRSPFCFLFAGLCGRASRARRPLRARSGLASGARGLQLPSGTLHPRRADFHRQMAHTGRHQRLALATRGHGVILSAASGSGAGAAFFAGAHGLA